MSTTLEALFQQHANLKVRIELAESDVDQATRSGCPAEIVRYKKIITDLVSERDAIGLAINTITLELRRRTEQEEKEGKWRELVGECREAKAEAERLAKALEVAQNEYVQAQTAADRAEHVLVQHQQNLLTPADFPLARLDSNGKLINRNQNENVRQVADWSNEEIENFVKRDVWPEGRPGPCTSTIH